MLIGIIGLGLIGGSIAKALEDYEIVAFDLNEEFLKKAKTERVISKYTKKIDSTFRDCDVVFVCTPVEYIVDYINQLKAIVKKSCLITDVGSTKESIANSINLNNFIGGHPMTGSEKNGYLNSNKLLLENAYYILTPKSEKDENIKILLELIQKMNSIPLIMSPKEHDKVVASISHVPHIIASALVNAIKKNDNSKQYMHALAAGGFRDITRIASSSPDVWESICLTNQNEIKNSLDMFIEELNSFKNNFNKEKMIYNYFSNSKKYRDSFEKSEKSSIESIYEFSVTVEDKPGIIADIATILANNDINIKNIGIVNNREFDEGALRIELYNYENKKRAIKLLNSLKYIVHVKG